MPFLILPCFKFASSQPVSTTPDLPDGKLGTIKRVKLAKTQIFV
jgi:hypothetical protein